MTATNTTPRHHPSTTIVTLTITFILHHHLAATLRTTTATAVHQGVFVRRTAASNGGGRGCRTELGARLFCCFNQNGASSVVITLQKGCWVGWSATKEGGSVGLLLHHEGAFRSGQQHQ
nr:hypothetical protein [Tanacetum cinerariifolium]